MLSITLLLIHSTLLQVYRTEVNDGTPSPSIHSGTAGALWREEQWPGHAQLRGILLCWPRLPLPLPASTGPETHLPHTLPLLPSHWLLHQ